MRCSDLFEGELPLSPPERKNPGTVNNHEKPSVTEIKLTQMSPSAGSIAPQHLLPYESELGADVSLESLIVFVSEMDKRPSIPKHWELLPQVFSHRCFLLIVLAQEQWSAESLNVLTEGLKLSGTCSAAAPGRLLGL